MPKRQAPRPLVLVAVAGAFLVAFESWLVFEARSGPKGRGPEVREQVSTTTAPSRAPSPAAPPPPALLPSPPPTSSALDAGARLERLRAVKDSDPELAVSLAREDAARFPERAEAAERASILIHALGALGRASEARGEAEDMVNRYPDSAWVREIEAYTGAHRRRNLRVNAAGELEAEP